MSETDANTRKWSRPWPGYMAPDTTHTAPTGGSFNEGTSNRWYLRCVCRVPAVLIDRKGDVDIDLKDFIVLSDGSCMVLE